MATAQYTGKMLSADSHVVEPGDLWQERIDAPFRDRAPHVASREDGDYIIVEGIRPRPLAFEGSMIDRKAQGTGIEKVKGYRFHEARPGGWDPDARMKDQDLDGVGGEVIYPGIGLAVWRTPDPELAYAAARAYNDWLADFCGAHPARLKGAAMLPARGPVEWAVAEAERCLKRGLVSVALPAENDARPYNLPDWDPLWAALQDLDVPCGLHIGGRDPVELAKGPGASGIIVGIGKMAMNHPLQQLIWGGAALRFPRLRWVLVEGGVGWIAYALTFMDHWWHDHQEWMQPRLPETPSTYFHRQFFATFEDDRPGILTRELLGLGNLMWGSDYPHTEGVWPFSRQQIARDFAGVPAAETRQIVCENVARLYGFTLAD